MKTYSLSNISGTIRMKTNET